MKGGKVRAGNEEKGRSKLSIVSLQKTNFILS